MTVIYTPKGAAREYSPKACNIYIGCSHKCKYCYCPSCLQRKRENYFINPRPRKDVLKNIEKELKKGVVTEQILLSFIGDVYCETIDNNETTREALKLFLEHKAPVSVLTKGGKRCLKDIDIFKQFGEHIQIGATLTFMDKEKSLEWESGATEPEERLSVLKKLHDEGIRTFASFEPVIEPEESLKLIKRTLEDDSVDIYKIGKLNHNKKIEETIDWSDFLEKALELVRGAGKAVYVKHDLRLVTPDIKLYGNEVLPDEHNVK